MHYGLRTSNHHAAAPAHLDLSRPLAGLALLSLTLYVAAMTLPYKMANNDLWIHLKTGEYVLTHGWVPIKDPYSFTAADHDYVAHEWLAGVLFYIAYSLGGIAALIALKAMLMSVAFALLYKTARLLGARLSVILPTFAALLYIVAARVVERPHIFSYLMIALYLWLFFCYREGGRDRRWLYVIPPVHALWTNLHGGHILGLALLAGFAMGEACIWLRARYLGIGAEKAIPLHDLERLALLVPACLIAALLNPYGYRLLTFPLELTGMQFFMQMIHEWKPPYHGVYHSTTMFFFYLLHLSLLSAAFCTVQRDRTQRDTSPLAVMNQVIIVLLILTELALAYVWLQWLPVSWNSHAYAIILYAMFGLFVLFSVVNLRSIDFTQAGICCLFFLLSLRHNRGVTDAALGTFPILAAAASNMLEQRDRATAREATLQLYARRPDRSTPAAVILGSCLLLGIAAYTLAFAYHYDFIGSRRQKGFGIAANMPTCAVDFIVRHELSGHAFVSYPAAALLIYRMSPAAKVNMDSRNDVYGEKLFREYLEALRSAEGMRGYLERYRIDFFLITDGDRTSAVFDELQLTGGWVPVHYDDRAMILVKRTAETEELIQHEGFRVITPPAGAEIKVDTTNAAQILEEADRALRNCPTSLFAHRYKEKALLALQQQAQIIIDIQDSHHRE